VAIQNDIDYLDIQYPYKEKIAVLKSLSKEIKKAGRCFITDGGFYPGLPAVLVRYAGLYFDSLEKANVSVVVKLDWKKHPGSTIRKSLVEINNLEIVFKQEQWKKARMFGMRDYISMDFGREFGRQYCVPMFLEEMRSIPEQYPSLLETGSFMGLNWFVTWIVYPLATIVSKISPKGSIKPMSRLMNWGLKRFSKPPYGTLLKIEAHGLKENKAKTLDITVYHKDGYMATAISVMACLLQYLNGSINKHGLHIHGNIVEPKQFMENMKRMGVEVNVQHNDR
jgi:saccharopine dehydrogenase (NAD+, L-lysine-forming)